MTDLRIDISTLGVPEASPGRPGPPGDTKSGRSPVGVWLRRLRWAVVLGVPLTVVPFILLLRGSVHAHTSWGTSPWISVALGAAMAVLTVGAAVWIVSWILKVPGGLRRPLSRGAVLMGLAFVLHGLLYIGVKNTKGDTVRSEYRALHPLLRVGSTVLVLLDGEAVMTDARRAPADYRAMGLPPLEASLHYPQVDGYVHALDLRTVDRPEWRNRMVEGGFRLMGFRVLRHVGTADHLHVSLPPPEAAERVSRDEPKKRTVDSDGPAGRVS